MFSFEQTLSGKSCIGKASPPAAVTIRIYCPEQFSAVAVAGPGGAGPGGAGLAEANPVMGSGQDSRAANGRVYSREFLALPGAAVTMRIPL